MKNLTEIFNINKGDVVSIVGSGGKTSLLFSLAAELKEKYKVLVSTSTRIIKPSINEYDYLYTDIKRYIERKEHHNVGITVVAKYINNETNKLIGIDDEDLDILLHDFDIVLLEADGSKELPLKGWKIHEPPVLSKTTMTIGVMPINLINKKASREIIYGFDEFNILTENSEYINFEAISRICSNENGIFKNSKGSLFLYLNQADTEDEVFLSKELSKYLKDFAVSNPYNFSIICGSLKERVYYEC